MNKKKVSRKSKVIIYEKRVIVNNDKKVVVCKLTCGIEFVYQPFDKVITRRLFFKKFPDVDCNMSFTVVGKAKCNEGDTFDIELGKSIAEGRAKSKMFEKASEIFNEIAINTNKVVNGCDDETIRYKGLANREEDHANSLIK